MAIKILFFLIIFVAKCHSEDPDPEIDMTTPEIILRWGYPAQVHHVTTEDGYILTLHRIPYGKDDHPSGERENKTVVFLQHGMDGSSSNWITNLPNESAGYLFADAGYDVWLGNFRGNKYSQGHQNPPSDKDYWKFSWDEMAEYDLPAMIEYTLNVTGQEQLYYIGHSMGTTTAFAKFSTDIAFSQKVKTFFALGPAITLKYIEGAYRFIAKFRKEIQWWFNIIDEQEISIPWWLHKAISLYVCGHSHKASKECENFFFLIAGPDTGNMNASRVPIFLAQNPAGSSTRTVIHYAQMVPSGKFCHYDFGEKGNMERYGQKTPPDYPLENITVPLYLFYGSNDYLADPGDVCMNIPRLKSLQGAYEIQGYNHLDFIWAVNARNDVYEKILDIIKKD